MAEQKFEISGEIEGGTPKGEKKSILGRFLLFLLVIVVVGSVWYFPFLQDEFPALKKITKGSSDAVTAADTTLINQNFELQEKVDSLLLANDSLQTVTQILSENGGEYTTTDGVHYEVQIGIFRHYNSDKYAEQTTGLYAEKISSGEAKITLGKFTDPNAAKDFLKDIKKMGFKDAWIVAKENGERVPFDN